MDVRGDCPAELLECGYGSCQDAEFRIAKVWFVGFLDLLLFEGGNLCRLLGDLRIERNFREDEIVVIKPQFSKSGPREDCAVDQNEADHRWDDGRVEDLFQVRP